MASAGTSSSNDAWGQSTTSVVSAPSRKPAQKIPVRDSWDDDDDDDKEEQDEPQGKDLWDQANSRTPMPHIQLSTTTATTTVPLPPTAALQGPLRILKRPSATSSSSPSPSGSAQAQKSFKEREAQYQAARERIFGEVAVADRDKDKDAAGLNASAGGSVGAKAKATTANNSKSSIIRDPLGPPAGAEGETKHGFRGRRRKGDQVEPIRPPTPPVEGTNSKDGVGAERETEEEIQATK